ncbi:MAG TPA: SRPBCC domain-containing protein [Burkholderiales bacterium]|nr:SRPBCC domain-containing protein [Burkholderiales bacterium]
MEILPPVEIRVRRRFSAPPEQIFDAWIDPATAGKWLFATAWRPMSRVTIDARAGGTFRFEERRDGGGIIQTGTYIEVARPGRLVFTLSGEKRRQDVARVSVDIDAADTGCELTLVHEGVLAHDAAHTEGRWAGMLYGLATMLGGDSRRAA